MIRVFGRHVFGATAILGITEAVMASAIIYAGAVVFSGNVIGLPTDLEVQVALIAVAVVIVMHSTGLYDRKTLTSFRHSLIKLGFVIGPIFALAVITTGILAKNDFVSIYPYRWQWTIALTTLWFSGVLAGRITFAYFQHKGTFARRIALLGGGQLIGRVRELEDAPSGSIQLVAQLDPSQIGATHQEEALELIRQAKLVGPHEIVIDAAEMSPASVESLIRCRDAGFAVVEFNDLYERETKRVDLASVGAGGLVFSSGFQHGVMFEAVKRFIDISLAIAGLIIFAPVMILAALALRFEGPGPIFYRQERVGRYGKSFMILKFRSMRVDAEESGIPRWAVEHDSRITPVGHVIRKVRVDEFPQFFNVLRGDMSVVGPRPERPYFVSELGKRLPFYDERHLVQPGITGWAQVHFRYGASFEDAKQKHSYDLYYLKHRSLLLDLIILLKTVRIVLFAEGSR